MTDDKNNVPDWVRQAALFASIPALMAVGPIIGYFIGRWIDNWLGTTPWLMVVFIFLGFAAAGKEIYNIVRKVNKNL